MPLYRPKFDNTAVEPCLILANKWQNWKPPNNPPKTKEFKSLKTLQKMVYLSTLLEGKPLSNTTLAKMVEVHEFDEEHDHVKMLWYHLSSKNKYEPDFEKAIQFVKYLAPDQPTEVAPLFISLLKWEDKKDQIRRIMNTLEHDNDMLEIVKIYSYAKQ